MAGFLSPFSCPQLNVNNMFFVNNTLITFGGLGTSAPFFMNTSSIVVNAVGGRVNVTATSIKISNQSTFFINLNSTGMVMNHPSLSTSFLYDQVNCVDSTKEYHINAGSIEVENTAGYAFTANLTEIRIGQTSPTANISKITPTKISIRNDNTFFSTSGLSINNQSTLNATTLTVSNISANFVVLETGSLGNTHGLSVFTTTSNGVAPATNSTHGDYYVLCANGNWQPPGMIYVTSGNLQGTPASPNAKFAEATWANTFGDIFVEGWFLPQSNGQDLKSYLFLRGAWQNTGGDYQQSQWRMDSNGFFNPDGLENQNTMDFSRGISNNVNRPVYIKLHIPEMRNDNCWVQYESLYANSTAAAPDNEYGWVTWRGANNSGANGVTGIRFYFPTGNIASARWTVRALHRRQA